MAYTGKLQLFRGVPLNIGNEDTWYFSSRYQQDLYFNSISNITFNATDYKFVREEGYIKVNKSHDFLENCNYLRFQNEDLTGQQTTRKWYYAFITGLRYISDNVTAVYFTLDVMQTWLPKIDYDLNQCLIEREHATTDEIGDNVATETIRGYKNKSYNEFKWDILNGGYYLCVLVTYQEGMLAGGSNMIILGKTVGDYDYDAPLGTVKLDGTVCGATILMFDLQTGYTMESDGLQQLRVAIKQTSILTQADYIRVDQIQNMYIVPKTLINSTLLLDIGVPDTPTGWKWHCKTMPTRRHRTGGDWEDYSDPILENVISPTNFSLASLGGYTPKNKKLFTSQYMNYNIVNTEGNIAIYEPEGFKKVINNVEQVVLPKFEVISSILPPNKITIRCNTSDVPEYYGAEASNEQLFPLGELPTVTIDIQTYREWIARQFVEKIQTAAPMALTAMSGIQQFANLGSGPQEVLANLNHFGKPGTVQRLEASSMAQKKLSGIKSDIVNQNATTLGYGAIRTANDIISSDRPTPICAGNGTNLGSTLLSSKLFFISIRQVAPVESELKRIDDYFTAYGYAMNVIDTPHIKVRRRFTYVKTRGARNTAKYDSNNANGVPAEYMEIINNMFDRGIRFWNEQVNFNDLTSVNSILPSGQWDN